MANDFRQSEELKSVQRLSVSHLDACGGVRENEREITIL